MSDSDRDIQNEPVQAGSTEASDSARLSGLLEQVRSDLRTGNASDAPGELRRRLDEAGFSTDGQAFERLLAEVTRP